MCAWRELPIVVALDFKYGSCWVTLFITSVAFDTTSLERNYRLSHYFSLFVLIPIVFVFGEASNLRLFRWNFDEFGLALPTSIQYKYLPDKCFFMNPIRMQIWLSYCIQWYPQIQSVYGLLCSLLWNDSAPQRKSMYLIKSCLLSESIILLLFIINE